MGWRTDFKKAIVDELVKIQDIGSVERSWKQEPVEYPALIVGLMEENREHTMGYSTGPVELDFTITGLVNDVEDPDEALEELLNRVIEKIEGLAIEGITITDQPTTIHEKVEGAQKAFTFRGKANLEKDYSNM